MLAFRSEANVIRWCQARSLPVRPLIHLNQLWFLAETWYGNRLTVESHRPGPQEMAGIFARIGLSGPFWDPHSDVWTSAT